MGILYWTLMIGFLIGALGKFFFQRMNQGEVVQFSEAGPAVNWVFMNLVRQ